MTCCPCFASVSQKLLKHCYSLCILYIFAVMKCWCFVVAWPWEKDVSNCVFKNLFSEKEYCIVWVFMSCHTKHLHTRHKALLVREKELRVKAEQKLIFWIREMKKLDTAVLICCMKDRSIVCISIQTYLTETRQRCDTSEWRHAPAITQNRTLRCWQANWYIGMHCFTARVNIYSSRPKSI